MSVKKQLYPVAVSVFFLLFLLLPGTVFLLGPRKEVSEAEKRKLAVSPELVLTPEALAAFPKQFDAFYQDHFGLRDHLVKWYNGSSLQLFRVSPSDLVIAGKDGWFFYTGEGVIEDYYGMGLAGPIALDRYAETLAVRRDWLARLGARYLLVPVPNKMGIYDAYLPARIRSRRGMSFYEQLTAFLPADGRFEDVIRLDEVLDQGKEKEQVYFKTDTHWSNAGALLAFNRIMAYCRRWFPGKVEQISEEEISRENVSFSGDQTRLMHQENEIGENINVVRVKAPCAGTKTDYTVPSVEDLDTHAVRKKEGEGLAEAGCPERELTALIIHDSFGIPLQRFFNERFKKVIYSTRMKLDHPVMQDIIIREHPDIVLEVWVARNLHRTLVPDPPEWTTAVLAQEYAASEEVRMRIDAAFDPARITARNQIEIEPQAEGLLLNALGGDPFFQVPFAPPQGEQERYLLEVELDAPRDTLFTLYFTLAEKPMEIREEQHVEAKVHKGRNRLLLHLPRVDIRGLLRIDPGRVAGSYLLRSLTIKAVPQGDLQHPKALFP